VRAEIRELEVAGRRPRPEPVAVQTVAPVPFVVMTLLGAERHGYLPSQARLLRRPEPAAPAVGRPRGHSHLHRMSRLSHPVVSPHPLRVSAWGLLPVCSHAFGKFVPWLASAVTPHNLHAVCIPSAKENVVLARG